MRSPQNMHIIQIEITNACVYSCSNCTRMCGHHEKTFMMDFETFKRAVDSLEGYTGTVSIMGGEPTLHPEFEKFALYLKSKYLHLYEESQDTDLLHPMDDFWKTVQDISLKYANYHEYDGNEIAMIPVPGLYSVTGKTYGKHFEVIQDVFRRQVLNDHDSEMYHQPALISRKDLGIDDETWVKLRDNCWIQNTWSASISPKGAFFCEIAAALDMLFDGPGGWPIEKDWWKREPKEFSDQLHWCELCGFACETFSRNAAEQVDDVSPSLYEKLKKVNSPKVNAGKVNVISVEDGVISEESKASGEAFSMSGVSTGSPYIKYIGDKFNGETSVLHPHNLVAVLHLTPNSSVEWLKEVVQQGADIYSHFYLICESEECARLWHQVSITVDASIYFLPQQTYGVIWNKILKLTPSNSHFVVMQGNSLVTSDFLIQFIKSIPNPGTLIYGESTSLKAVPQWVKIQGDFDAIVLFHNQASSLRDIGFDRVARMESFSGFVDLWKEAKKIAFDERLFAYSSKNLIQEGERCAIFGAGGRGLDLYDILIKRKATCVAVVDSDPKKQGSPFEHLVIGAPDSLGILVGEIDRILIGTPIFLDVMTEKLVELGFDPSIISVH